MHQHTVYSGVGGVNPQILSKIRSIHIRDGKTYERASNARVYFFIVWVKSVTNSTLFCLFSELYAISCFLG